MTLLFSGSHLVSNAEFTDLDCGNLSRAELSELALQIDTDMMRGMIDWRSMASQYGNIRQCGRRPACAVAFIPDPREIVMDGI
jgi:hypothetical protein